MSDPPIEILHVGSASRDIVDDDPRGWRLGGGVTFAALATARLGLRTAAVVGVDAETEDAAELKALREAGVELRVVRLAESPAFRNEETPGGRIQTCVAPGRPLPVVDLPRAWLAAPGWSLVAVAGEIGDDWAAAVPSTGFLVVAWQGLLRELAAGQVVGRRPPVSVAVIRRADLVGVSRQDLPRGTDPADVARLLHPGSSLLVTEGANGGRVLRTGGDGSIVEEVRYQAVPPDREVDMTGAGDTFLAALLVSIIGPRVLARQSGAAEGLGPGLAFAAAAASLTIEGPGLLGVPDLAAVQARVARWRGGSDGPAEG